MTSATSTRRFLGKCKRCKRAMRLELVVERTRTEEARRCIASGLALSPAVRVTYRVTLPTGRSLTNHGACPSFGHDCECGASVLVSPVVGRRNDAIKCTARCMGATGHDCECSCAGKNHGASIGGAS